MIQSLLITTFGMLFSGIVSVILGYNIDKINGFYTLLYPCAYSLIMFIYYIYHSLQHLSVKAYFKSGVILWREKHDKISIFIHTYNYMYLFLICITFSNSLYLQPVTGRQIQMERNENISRTSTISGNVDQYRLEVCHWEFESLNIVDMMLFASLAYMQTNDANADIETFYKGTNLLIEFDDEFNAFIPHGHSEISYFTVTTSTAVLVSIRGTQLDYEWLIDFNIRSESVINQKMSILFPCSRLYPHYLNKLIIQYMSTVEHLVLENPNSNPLKRFYIPQLISILKKNQCKIS